MGNMGTLSSLGDSALLSRLSAYEKKDSDHWSFRGNASRQHGHAYFQYPAMMVPQMVGDLLTAISANNPNIRRVYDPFAGSGTALTEAMMRGLDFNGQDINPLAVLLCQAKSIPFFDAALVDKLDEIVAIARSDSKRSLEVSFAGRKKWFSNPVTLGLSRLRRAIRAESTLWARRFFWVALAETVRITSNSRTSTFKLHIRSKDDIESRRPLPIEIFLRIGERNIEHLRAQKESLIEKGFIKRGHYIGQVKVNVANSTNARHLTNGELKHDILVTSPPYGDNATTVPYGQHSYLPLQWIDLSDISSEIDVDCLSSTHAIDSHSLGGSKRGASSGVKHLADKSSTFAKSIAALRSEPADRSQRVVAFCRDLEKCIEPILAVMRPDAVMIWVLGNRRVGGKTIPLDRILSEFLINYSSRSIAIIKRDIPSKRMALRNRVSATMRTENIIVFRK